MNNFLNIGLDALQKKDLRGAFEAFSKAIEVDPKNANAYCMRGDMHLNILNNFDKAIEDLSRAIEIAPNFAYAHKLRGICYKKIDNLIDAKKDWEKASNLGDLECEKWISEKEYKRLDKLSGKELEKISNDKLKKIFLAELSILQLENINGCFENRIRIIQNLIFEIDNNIYKNPYHKHSETKNNFQLPKKGKNQVIPEISSKKPKIIFRLATLGGIAITLLSTFFIVRNKNNLIMKESANYSFIFNNQSIPRKIFNKLDAKVYYLTGLSKLGDEKYRESIENFTKALKIDSDDFYSYYERGWVKYEIKDYAGAINDFTRGIELKPSYSDAFYGRGLSKAFLENDKEAIKDFTKALELNPKDSDAYYQRGYSKFNLYNFKGALEDFNRSLEINPYSSMAILERGYLKFKLKDYRGACEDFDKVKSSMIIEKKYLRKCKK